jgi:hypothetical protein
VVISSIVNVENEDWVWWLTLKISTIWEAEIRGMSFEADLGKKLVTPTSRN